MQRKIIPNRTARPLTRRSADFGSVLILRSAAVSQTSRSHSQHLVADASRPAASPTFLIPRRASSIQQPVTSIALQVGSRFGGHWRPLISNLRSAICDLPIRVHPCASVVKILCVSMRSFAAKEFWSSVVELHFSGQVPICRFNWEITARIGTAASPPCEEGKRRRRNHPKWNFAP